MQVFRKSCTPAFRSPGGWGGVGGEDRNPLHYNGASSPVRQDGSLSLREGVPVLGRRTRSLRHFREAVVSVRERQCGPGSPAPLFTTLPQGASPSLREAAPIRPDGSLSLREGVPGLGRRPHYLRHLREAGRSVCERQRRSGETGRSVCERECWSWAAGPIIYGTSARRVAQFARGSAVRGRRPHYLRYFRGNPRGGGWETQSRR